MSRSQIAVTIAVGVLTLGCTSPPPAPKPLKTDRAPTKQRSAKSAAVRVPKFDVAPPGPVTRPTPRDPPKGMTQVRAGDDTIRIDIRYATADNFTGAPLEGYLPGVAWLTQPAADALAKVQGELAPDGLGILVFDAYRPLRATKAMVAWAEATKRTKLLDDGYIARASNHNRGNTLDLTLVTLADGTELDMGTAWDTFSPASHYGAAQGEAKANRKRLRAVMTKHGFVPFEKEWWHFTLSGDPAPPPLDIPYANDP